MKKLIQIAWRNIFRNKLRSFAIMCSVLLGLLAGIFASALVKGMMDSRFDNFIEKEISHIQVHHPKYIGRKEIVHYLEDYPKISQQLMTIEGIQSVSPRTKIQGMIASATFNGGVQLNGIAPLKEHHTTGFADNMVEGSFLEQAGNSIVIGKYLADKMKVGLGSRVVLSFQDKENNLISAAFTVGGVFTSYYKRFDESQVFVNIDYLNKHLGIEGGFHEIAVLAKHQNHVESIKSEVKEILPFASVRSWDEISPELLFWVETGSTFSFIFITVILIGLAFGLLNTMLMSIFERTRELGMLMAIGMNKTKVFWLIVLETAMLSLIGAILGIISATILVSFFSKRGINLNSFSDVMHEIGFETMIYPQLDYPFLYTLPFLVVATALIAAVYPALKALRLSPAEAVRK
jgi:putative ABC transport system permease protein